MATFAIYINKNHKRSTDGKYPVTIRVCWKRKYGFIKTGQYVSDKQIDKRTFTLRDNTVISDLNARISKYENIKATKLGYNIEMYTARELADYFYKEGAPGTDNTIDFIEFAALHCKRLRAKGRDSTAKNLESVVNAVIDFCNGRKQIYMTEITAKFLKDLESFLEGTRTIKRKNQFGEIVTTERKGLSKVSVHDYMVAIRTIFNAAISEYNDEDRDEIRIKHYPFRKYKIKPVPESEKRSLTADQIRKIITLKNEDLKFPRAILGRDVFLLSFYLAGMNLADMYDVKALALFEGRISYNRQKTRARRQDNAYISVKLEPEAMELFERYKSPAGEYLFKFASLYTTASIFVRAVNEGLEYVAKAIDIPELTSYYARFSFATIARNDCSVSRDDIDLALNHVDQGLKMADVYIKKDWSVVDRAVRKVIDFLK